MLAAEEPHTAPLVWLVIRYKLKEEPLERRRRTNRKPAGTILPWAIGAVAYTIHGHFGAVKSRSYEPLSTGFAAAKVTSEH